MSSLCVGYVIDKEILIEILSNRGTCAKGHAYLVIFPYSVRTIRSSVMQRCKRGSGVCGRQHGASSILIRKGRCHCIGEEAVCLDGAGALSK